MKVLIVGSGIIGLAAGYELSKRGCEVVLVGDRAPGAGASANNAGWIVPTESGPLPAPGLVLQALRWMVRPDSPVYVRPSLRPAFIRFMVAMARACNPAAYSAAFEATAVLGRGTMDALDRWAADGLAFEMHEVGEVHAFVEPAELRRAAVEIGRYERAGFAAGLLSGDEARAAVPELSDAVVGAIRFPAERHVHPATLVAALAGRLRAMGATFVEGTVTGGRIRPVGGIEVAGSFGSTTADAAIIAAGAWSARVATRFGARLPIQPGKGYSVDYVPPPSTLRVPLMLAEAHCVMTPLDGALRVAGTMEFGGFDEGLSATRIGAIRQAPGRYLRSWDPDASSQPPAAGLRPMTPDGLPIIGRLRGTARLYVATGHAMLGLTLAPRTGALLAEMIVDGTEPAVLEPFSPRRFGR